MPDPAAPGVILFELLEDVVEQSVWVDKHIQRPFVRQCEELVEQGAIDSEVVEEYMDTVGIKVKKLEDHVGQYGWAWRHADPICRAAAPYGKVNIKSWEQLADNVEQVKQRQQHEYDHGMDASYNWQKQWLAKDFVEVSRAVNQAAQGDEEELRTMLTKLEEDYAESVRLCQEITPLHETWIPQLASSIRSKVTSLIEQAIRERNNVVTNQEQEIEEAPVDEHERKEELQKYITRLKEYIEKEDLSLLTGSVGYTYLALANMLESAS